MSIVRFRCLVPFIVAGVVLSLSCAGSPRIGALTGAAPTSGGTSDFSLSSAATLVELSHDVSAETSQWSNSQAPAPPPAPAGVEVGFAAPSSDSGPRGLAVEPAASPDSAGQSRLRRLVAPLVVIDMCYRTARDSDAELSVGDIEAFELLHGNIEPGSAVLVRTCWYWRWGNRDHYLGVTRVGGHGYHFPGVSWPAANALIERGVVAVAIDTAAVDNGSSPGGVVKRTLERAEIEVLVDLIAYQDIPARGATLMALPMRVPGSDRTPLRVLAITP